jgi:glycosyltransferase involved in cell wall biosynthesis
VPRSVILYVVNEFSEASSNFLVRHMIAGLDPQRYELHVGSVKPGDGPMARGFAEAGASVAWFGRNGTLRAIPEMVSYIRRHQVDIVHTHVLKADLAGAVAARLARGPLVISTKHNIAFVPGQSGWLVRDAAYWPAMLMADRVVTVSQAHLRELRTRLPFLGEKLVGIHNGVVPERYYVPEAREPYRRELGYDEQSVVLLFAGRLVPGKGLPLLVRVVGRLMQSLSQVRLLIVGQGPLGDALRQQTIDLGIQDRATITGFRRDMAQILAAADVFALPSDAEGLPLSLLEAMAAGKAVVVTPVGGVREVVVDGVSGLFVQPRDEIGLESRLLSLVADREKRQQMGERARARVADGFSVQQMVARYDELYQSILPLRQRRGAPQGGPRRARPAVG